MSRLGHNMRGNGVSYGFPDISAIGEELEAAAGAKDAGRVGEQLAVLEAWIADVADAEMTGEAAHRPESGTHVRATGSDGESSGGGED